MHVYIYDAIYHDGRVDSLCCAQSTAARCEAHVTALICAQTCIKTREQILSHTRD